MIMIFRFLTQQIPYFKCFLGSGVQIDGEWIDLVKIWDYAKRGEVFEGITPDSVFSYLKNTHNKAYFEIPPSKDKPFTFNLKDAQ